MINIRKAGMDDCNDILLWRNDKETLESSFNSETIPYEDHLKWYRQALGDDNRIIFVGENPDGSKFGMIRFDRTGPDTYEVSVNLAPEYRGKGLGTQLITQASGLMKGKITAKIKTDNPISCRVFQISGYEETRNEDGMIYMEYVTR